MFENLRAIVFVNGIISTIDRSPINLPRKALGRPLNNLRHELDRNRQRIELVNEKFFTVRYRLGKTVKMFYG